MRKMFSKNQIKELAVEGVNAGISSGSVQVGTKLYKHEIKLDEDKYFVYIDTFPINYAEDEDDVGYLLINFHVAFYYVSSDAYLFPVLGWGDNLQTELEYMNNGSLSSIQLDSLDIVEDIVTPL